MNNVERQCWANAQYSIRECLEVVGIPYSIKIQDLKGKVCSFFNRVGVSVNPDDIEACHRLYNGKKMVVKFSKCKLCQQFLREKKELKNVDLASLIFRKAQLSMKVCAPITECYGTNVRSSGNKKLIYTYFTSNGNIQYRIRENGNFHTVTQITDFKKNFPGIGISDL